MNPATVFALLYVGSAIANREKPNPIDGTIHIGSLIATIVCLIWW